MDEWTGVARMTLEMIINQERCVALTAASMGDKEQYEYHAEIEQFLTELQGYRKMHMVEGGSAE